ncbi:MAG: AgmX/PglI C-terminal domain-containing protein [Polyangiaceae bacterium]
MTIGSSSNNPFLPGGFLAPTLLANPFVETVDDEVGEDAPEGSYTYAMVKTAPAVPADEVETADASVELTTRWGTSVLHVAHLTPPRSFYVGEEQHKAMPLDFFLPEEKLGATRAPIVLADGRGNVSLVLPPRATGTVDIPGAGKRTVGELLQGGAGEPCAELAGARALSLPAGSRARIVLGDLVFEVNMVNAGRVVAGHFAVDTQAAPYHGLSALMHIGLLAAAALFVPALGGTEDGSASSDDAHMIGQYLAAAAAAELEERPADPSAGAATPAPEGGTGDGSRGEEGKLGSQTSTATNKRYAIEKTSVTDDPHMARIAALRDAADFGMIGLLNAGAGGDPKAPTAPWGQDTSNGKDAISALGNMWGAELGEAAGMGGLGLTGIGEGGGRSGLGIGLGNVGTLGHGAGLGDGQGFGDGPGGFGRSGGRLPPNHVAAPPRMRVGTVDVGGHLPPEVIQRVVRQNFGRFRLCYENALRNNPNLQGRVTVRFVIGRDGAVSQVSNGASDLPDAGAVSCVVRAFYGLSFPQPSEGGIVTVGYPIMFTPGQ